MNKQIIYHQSGTTISTDALLETLKLNEPEWSWYEPKPESLIGKDKKIPLCTLQKGLPDIDDGIEFSECMLFYPKAGITLIPKGGKYKYFYWSENSISEDKLITQKTKPEDAYLKSKKILKDQFGIENGCYPDLPKKLKIIQYHHNDHCIAWTITDTIEEK